MIIDGSYGEGGGQILRISIALAAILGEDIEIINIRAKRKNPGLRPQHLWGIKLVGMMSNANISELRVGSLRVSFSPGRIKGGEYRIDIGTAGSITLLLQTSILPALFADSKVILKLRGGTDVPWSPPVDYYRYVLSPLLARMGANVKIEVLERGYYPQGGGSVRVEVDPGELEGIDISSRGEFLGKKAYLNMRKLPYHILERMKNKLRNFRVFEDVKSYGKSVGCGIVLVEEYENTIFGSDSLCKKGVAAEKVVENVSMKLNEERKSWSTVDVNMGDHLLPFGFLGEGTTTYYVKKVTNHIRTNAWLVKKFGGKIQIAGNKIEIM